MTPLDHAVQDITGALDSLGIAYAIIGGIANAIVRRRIGELDLAFLEPRIRELATALESDAILERWRKWLSNP